MAGDEDKKGSSEPGRDRPSWVDDDPFTNRVVIKPPSSSNALARTTPSTSEGSAEPKAQQPKAEEPKAEEPEVEEPKAEPNTQQPKAEAPASPTKPTPTLAAQSGQTQTGPRRDPTPVPAGPKVDVDPHLLGEARRQGAPVTTAASGATAPGPGNAPYRGAAAGGPAPRGRRKVPTEALPRVAGGHDRQPPPYSDDDGAPRPPGRRFLHVPLWSWLLVLVAALLVVPLTIDLLNRGRFRLTCQKELLEAKRHRRFPWPVGFERLGGPLRPVKLFSETTCAGNQDFDSREELEAAFLDLIVSQVRRGVANPASRDLKILRAQINQARQLALLDVHAARRKEIRQILADLNYREGRARLGRVEMSLREALALLREAQKLAGSRYEDLADWISHIESLLRTLAPPPSGSTLAPGALMPGLPMPKVPPSQGARPLAPPAAGIPPTPALPRRPPTDGGSRTPDAGSPSEGSGILM